MYSGTLVNDLIATVDGEMTRTGDDYIDLGTVKTILADRRPMTVLDEALWREADRLQELVLNKCLSR